MAEAYVLKGQTYLYTVIGWAASNANRDLVLDSVKSLGNKALLIDKFSADAYVLISTYFFGKNKEDSGAIYLEKALAINANNFDANRYLGGYFGLTDAEKAIRFCKKAIRVNPLSPWTPLVYADLGFTYHNFGAFEKAELYGKKAVGLSSNSMIAVEALRSLT